MSTEQNTNEPRDEILWKKAKKRASFRYHALIYFIIILFFWTMYYISIRTGDKPVQERAGVPWPLWPMLGWGIALFFHYMAAYSNKETLAEKEYHKLKNNRD